MSTIALVGSDSLLGREIRDIVATADTGIDLRLLADTEELEGSLTRVGNEPAVVGGLSAAALDGARAVFLAGSAEAGQKALELAGNQTRTTVIDLTGAAEDRPDARLRAPLVESSEDSEAGDYDSAVQVIAHPAAIALALFLRRLHSVEPVLASVIQIFAPASEHGTAGVEELQGQTVSLLSFKKLPQEVFDAQLSFSMLAKYGEEAKVALEETELRIERHLATLLALPGTGEGVPMPSLRLIQAPVFHGYSFGAWVEFASDPNIETLESGLVTGTIEVRGSDFEAPTNVGQAGQAGIAVGAISPDRNRPDACWFWLAADNLRLTAENGVAVARQLI
ncbi:MAG TPA: Asd/ArgC dimerization domain-containing protein [Bryobacteraceae bacterium]|nr:Asd/ArgC dimerization domain-containing protein [Bryobacteraceae bacterium]